ncbi:hypothetical protein QUF72_05045 [Desulfobacterales bacterium HSG2]|nr:hypothetical protein [Desulfobacterales bacterium HSG2]
MASISWVMFSSDALRSSEPVWSRPISPISLAWYLSFRIKDFPAGMFDILNFAPAFQIIDHNLFHAGAGFVFGIPGTRNSYPSSDAFSCTCYLNPHLNMLR